jgi:biopolymer transport protein ExbB
MLFGDIAKNMMFDGWAVIFCCIIMALVGWTVAIRKFLYLNKIQKGSAVFEDQWRHVAADLTVLDHGDEENVKSLGGKADAKSQKLVHLSPLYHIYKIGTEEIRHRLENSRHGFHGLSGRSIQAIRASLDAGLTREVHRLNDGLIFLTISIAGGPYVGLLGTVMGVMITFAVIAKSGEVEVNSIAPGIASALLATVAGLIVAIPALFIYSYLNSRIKSVIGTMQLFIDEFVTRMAEFYPTPADVPVPVTYAPAAGEAKATEASTP